MTIDSQIKIRGFENRGLAKMRGLASSSPKHYPTVYSNGPDSSAAIDKTVSSGADQLQATALAVCPSCGREQAGGGPLRGNVDLGALLSKLLGFLS